jgi:hypothetical protein
MLRAACPELAILVEDSAMRDLGEAFPGQTSRAGPVYVTPVNDLAAFARDARGARDAGAAMHDFGEALYITAVTAGVPRAVAATRVLLDVFAEDRSPCHVMPGPRPSI